MKLRTVQLRMFCDHGNGEYGLAHANCIDTGGYSNGFNAFWSGLGIFHDVWEHYFEGDKYFQEDNFMNIGGEMAAMGHALVFYNCMRIRHGNSWNHYTQSIASTTYTEIQESISEGYSRYGNTLACAVPRQRNVHDASGYLENIIYDVYTESKKAKYEYINGEDKEYSDMYRKSVTKTKIRRLHEWGFKQAEKMLSGNQGENIGVLTKFFEYWEKFTSRINAEEFNWHFDGITFYISKYKGTLKWKAELISRDGDNVIIKSNNLVQYDLLELIGYEDESYS